MDTLKKIVVTPAGREKYLKVLYKHLKRAFDRNSIHEWHLWVNTSNKSDIDYMNSLAANNSWIKTKQIEGESNYANHSICKFFTNACDEYAVYVRLDDDIVFTDNNFFDTIFKYRIDNPDPFLVYANIINNAVISTMHQKNNLFSYHKLSSEKCMDDVGWKDPEFAKTLHLAFIDDVNNGRIDKWMNSFSTRVIDDYNRVSINCISWLGKTFKEFNGIVDTDEEEWLSVIKPKQLQKPNVIIGNAIVVHFAFYTQREYLDSTDILSKYNDIADRVTSISQ